MKNFTITAAIGMFIASSYASAEVTGAPSSIKCELINTAFSDKLNLSIKVPTEKTAHLTLSNSKYQYLDHATMAKLAIGSIEFDTGNSQWDRPLIITQNLSSDKYFTAIYFNDSAITTIQIGDKFNKNSVHMYSTGYTGHRLSTGTCSFN